jgi:hypothetical protein
VKIAAAGNGCGWPTAVRTNQSPSRAREREGRVRRAGAVGRFDTTGSAEFCP